MVSARSSSHTCRSWLPSSFRRSAGSLIWSSSGVWGAIKSSAVDLDQKRNAVPGERRRLDHGRNMVFPPLFVRQDGADQNDATKPYRGGALPAARRDQASLISAAPLTR